MAELDLGRLKADQFEPCLDQPFQIDTPAGALQVMLRQLKRHGPALRDGGAFSLLFVAGEGQPLPQSIYPLSHLALGTLEIFLVPIGPVPGGFGYEAVFT